MTKNHRRRSSVLAILVATAALEIGASQAQADWGWGGVRGIQLRTAAGRFFESACAHQSRQCFQRAAFQ